MDDDKTEGEDLDSTEMARPDSPDLPERVGPYRILELLGEGILDIHHIMGAIEMRSENKSGRGQQHLMLNKPLWVTQADKTLSVLIDRKYVKISERW